MAIGPVQLIVLGFEHPQFHGEIIEELERAWRDDLGVRNWPGVNPPDRGREGLKNGPGVPHFPIEPRSNRRSG